MDKYIFAHNFFLKISNFNFSESELVIYNDSLKIIEMIKKNHYLYNNKDILHFIRIRRILTHIIYAVEQKKFQTALHYRNTLYCILKNDLIIKNGSTTV